MTKASDLLTTAAQIVGGSRNTTHGDKERSFNGIADMWNAYIQNRPRKTGRLDAQDVAHMMVLMKMMRSQYGEAVDDHFIDMAGYAAIAGEVAIEPFEAMLQDAISADSPNHAGGIVPEPKEGLPLVGEKTSWPTVVVSSAGRTTDGSFELAVRENIRDALKISDSDPATVTPEKVPDRSSQPFGAGRREIEDDFRKRSL